VSPSRYTKNKKINKPLSSFQYGIFLLQTRVVDGNALFVNTQKSEFLVIQYQNNHDMKEISRMREGYICFSSQYHLQRYYSHSSYMYIK